MLLEEHLLEKYKNGTCVQCMINGENVLKPSLRLSPIPELPTPESEKLPIINDKVVTLDDIKVEPPNPEVPKVEPPKPVEIPVAVTKKTWCCF